MPRIQRFYQTTVSTTISQLVPYNKQRKGILIRNNSGNPCYLSNDQANVATLGYPLNVGEFLAFLSVDGDIPELQIYGLTSVGTADLRIVETFGEVES